MRDHRHRAVPSRSETRAYMGAVAWPEERRAHGAVCHIDHCRCGANRRTNTNGRFTERGPWLEAEETPCNNS